MYSIISSSLIKIGEILSMGIPLNANSIDDTTQLLSDENAGILIRNFTSTEYDIAAAAVVPDLKDISPQSLRSFAEKYFDLK